MIWNDNIDIRELILRMFISLWSDVIRDFCFIFGFLGIIIGW